MFPRAGGHKPQAGGRCHQGFRTMGLESRKAALDLGSWWGHSLLSPSSDGGLGWGRRPLAEPAFPPRPQPAHRVHLHTASTFRSHARAPCVRPTSIALPGSAGRHSFGSAPRAGISHQRAGVGQPDAAGWKVWSADRGLQSRGSLPLAQAPAGPGRVPAGAVSSAVGRQRACTSHPPTRPCGTGGPWDLLAVEAGAGAGGAHRLGNASPPSPW